MRMLSTLLIAGIALLACCRMIAAEPRASDVIQSTPNLVGFWDFAEPAGQARLSKGTVESHPLAEQNGPIQRHDDGPISGHSAYLNGSNQFFRIPHEQTADLNICGPGAQVSMIAFIRQTRMSKTIAGMWSEGSGAGDLTGVRQYALLMDMPTYGGDDKVTPHISANGGPSQRADGTYLPWNADYAASQSTVAVGEWVSVGFTYDGAWVRAYYNGVCEPWQASPAALNRTDTYFTQEGPDGGFRGINPYYMPDGIYTFDPDDPIKPDEGAPFTVGARQAVGKPIAEPFQGYFGGLAVFDRALTDAEMLAIHGAAFAVDPTPDPSDVLYQQDFTTAGDSNVSIDQFNTAAAADWRTAWGPTAQSTNTVTDGEGIRIADSTLANGYYLAFVPGASSQFALAWTEQATIPVTDIATLGVRLNSKSAADAVRFAVRIDGQWFATADAFSLDPPGIAFNNWSNAQTFEWTWTAASAAWLDLTLVSGATLALGGPVAADLNGTIDAIGLFGSVAADGLIRADDLTVIAREIVSIPGDANLDGSVSLADFVILKNSFGSSPPSDPRADFNGDGAINLEDFVILKNNFGS